ncbi:MAG: hypothetical protein K9L78_03330 [Victivallales bacterium]|nr:hypothetical protein [Victivallales bacterium]
MKKTFKKLKFTLVEMVITVVILVVISVILMVSFDTIRRATKISSSQTELFQNASIALDLITRDLQCIYYENGLIPFYHKGARESDSHPYKNDLLCFISSTPEKPTDANTNVCEIKYQLYSTDDLTEDSAGWMLRSATGDMLDASTNNPKWNFWENQDYFDMTESSYAFTANSNSSSNYEKLIPYVTELKFTCYSRNEPSTPIAGDEADSKTFPYTVEVKLKLLDRESWQKWISVDSDHSDGESLPAQLVRRKNERTFTKAVEVGNRGQYQ